VDPSQMAIAPLVGEDENALIESLGRFRREASAWPPQRPLGSPNANESSPDNDLPLRAAIVAASYEEAASKAELLEGHLVRSPGSLPVLKPGMVAASRDAVSSVGLLFPGQGSPAATQLGALGEHVPTASALHREVGLPPPPLPPELTQLAIVASSLAVLCTLEDFNLTADFAIGHSLGELVALHWAGAYDRATLLKMTRMRGTAMTRDAMPGGAMAAILASEDRLSDLLSGGEATIACFNGPRQHVVSGTREAIEAICGRARDLRIPARRLEVTGAFHSPLMTPAMNAFARGVAALEIDSVRRPVVSTVTGGWLESSEDIRDLLVRQIESPVRFQQAIEIATGADLLIEAGPGNVLSGLARELTDTPVVSLRADGDEADYLRGVAALWACGVIGSPWDGLRSRRS
jgi:enediyne polyketide synthase